MRTKKSLLMVLMFMFVFMGAFVVNKDTAKADENPYYIKVNKGTNVVTVYKADGTAYKAFVCSTGSATPTGTYNTKEKKKWGTLMGPSYGQYCTRIVDGILFHSVWYYYSNDKSSQSTVQYNKLGTTASHGCVRLTVADCKWIYDNCPVGTQVTIFNGSSKDDPLGKPQAIIVSTASKMGWDPTDPDPSNPYLKKAPTITSDKDAYEIKANTTVKLKDYASARAAYGPYLDRYMEVYIKASGAKAYKKISTATYRFTKAGKYSVLYKVKDPDNGKSASKTITLTVKDTGKPIISGTGSNRTISYKTKLNLKKNVKVVTASGTNLKSYLSVKITNPAKSSFTLKTNEYTFGKLGTYYVTYTAVNPATKNTASKTIKIVVKDTKAPVISGTSAVTKEYKSKFNVKSGVTAKAVTGTNLTGRIKVTAKDPSGNTIKITGNCITLSSRGTYKITYTVTGLNGKTATKTRSVKSVDTGTPVLSGVPTSAVSAGYKQNVNLRSKVKALTANKTNLTSKIVITVKNPSGSEVTLDSGVSSIALNMVGTYTVKYSVVNPNGKKSATKSCKYVAKFMPVFTTASNVTSDLSNGSLSINVTDNYSCLNKYGTNISLEKYASVAVTYTKPGETDSSSVTLDKNSFIAENPGVYKVIYTAKGTNVVTTRKIRTITITDSADTCNISWLNSDTYYTNHEYDFTNAVSVTTKNDSELTPYLEIKEIYYFDEENEKVAMIVDEGKTKFVTHQIYYITYSVKDSAKKYFPNITDVTTTLEVFDDIVS